MKCFCQISLAALLVGDLLLLLHRDIDGCEAKEPAGFGGVVRTLIVMASLCALYYGAGAFSSL